MDERLAQAWRDAGEDLGLRIVAPYRVALQSGASVDVEAFIPGFGSPSGTIILSEKTERRERLALKQRNDLWLSIWPVEGTPRRYQRGVFIDVLRDFGWFGPAAEKPIWLG